uniref:Uncharacterized protein n=1 Tax=Hemiselmis tepida TaxID=464990 RepID=A0A7S0VRG8_9CRYP|mmetsp:Transcript_25259/g.64030  ORF Transcript_25259/g.64030 Transcript_25259/m.64030 type:complete len:211 (+) Transcript_25259:63-695(+)
MTVSRSSALLATAFALSAVSQVACFSLGASHPPLGLRLSTVGSSTPARPWAAHGGARCVRAVVFEPQGPPVETYASMALISGLAAYWWLVFVPGERRDLAANKDKGGLNGFLDELAASGEDERKVEKWFYSEWLARRKNVQAVMDKRAMQMSAKTGESFEVVLARLEEAEAANNLARATKMPRFLSADNPILVAFAFVAFGVVLAAFTGK